MFRFASLVFCVLSVSTTASAAPSGCVGMHKDLITMTKQMEGLVILQSDLVDQITAHDDARISAEQDLSMAAMDASVDSGDKLKNRIVENRKAGTAKRAELDAVNSEILTLNDKHNIIAARFNDACVR